MIRLDVMALISEINHRRAEEERQAAKGRRWVRWASIFEDSPDDPHFFDTEEKAVGMLGASPGRVSRVEVVETTE